MPAAYAVSLSLCLVMGCDVLLGIEDTAVHSGDAGASGNGGSSASSGAETGGRGGTRQGTGGSTEPNGGVSDAATSGTGGNVPTGGFDGTDANGGVSQGGESGAGESGGPSDGGAGTGGAAGTPSWTPDDLRGVVLWLDPSESFELDPNSRVVSWNDRSIHRHRALQDNPQRRPIVVDGAFGNYAGVQFDGSDDFLAIADAASLQLGTATFIVEIVFSHTTLVESSGSGGSIILSKQSPDGAYPGIGIFANRSIGTVSSERLGAQLDLFNVAYSRPEFRANTGLPMVLGMHRMAVSEFSLRLNGDDVDYALIEGALAIDASANNCEISGFPSSQCSVYVGGAPNAVQQLRGVIAEIVVARDVGPNDVERLERYLTDKYADVIGRKTPSSGNTLRSSADQGTQ